MFITNIGTTISAFEWCEYAATSSHFKSESQSRVEKSSDFVLDIFIKNN
ncbi:hypothetical protein PFLA_a3673 [Pseudoalteromonas flavipulchra NCIMB 2033 = ATCC BAA-314]|nr:hypothetical protein [Pseudoalteromonas flavipulchra NCIMB 2033 = ATCC BAA-314]